MAALSRRTLINNKKPLAVIILAAGKGTRMDSDLPKVLHEVGGMPMICQVVNTAKAIGADRIIPVLGHKYELVQDILKDEHLEFVLQLQQLGTAHAVLQCKKLLSDFNGDVLILYGDAPLITKNTLQNLLNIHNKTGAPATILTTDLPDPFGYGRIIRNPDNSLNKIVEEKDATVKERNQKEVNSGFYIFKAKELFELLPQVGNENAQNEYYLPDVLNMLINKKEKVAIDKINNYIEIQGVNNTEQLNEVNEYYEKA